MDATTINQPLPKDSKNLHGENALRVLAGLVGIGLAIIVLYATQSTSIESFLSVVGVSAVLAGAALLSGGVLGFLFGIPRMLGRSVAFNPTSTDTGISRVNPTSSTDSDNTYTIQYQPNTNLEDISDWLTKILVGVGLTQISTISGRLQAFADFAAPALGGFPSSGMFAIGILVYNLICGFLIGYLWTRLYLAGAFREADELERLKSTVDELDARVSQQQLDAHTLALIEQQLTENDDNLGVPQAELNEAIAKASEAVQTLVFRRVDVARPDLRNDPTTRAVRTHTIPILRALIAFDRTEKWDKSRALLAIAQMYQDSPDWETAKELLDKAIEIRDRRLKKDSTASRWYEYYRAICHMALDPNQTKNTKADDKQKRLVLNDLEAATKWRGVEDASNTELAKEDSIMKTWLGLNEVTWPPTAGS